MKAVILSAGCGSRLGRGKPKSLTMLDEKRNILDLQLLKLKEKLDINEIMVTIGYKKELIIKKYPELSFAHNDNYANTNTAKSLLAALKKIGKSDVIWLNGDVVFDSNILESIVDNANNNVICVNNNPPEGIDEEIKYSIDNNGYIKETSKYAKNTLGELVGINFIKKEDLPIFVSNLEKCDNSDYFDRAIQLSIEEGVNFLPIDIKENFCIEIDYEEELKIAKQFIKNSVNLEDKSGIKVNYGEELETAKQFNSK